MSRRKPRKLERPQHEIQSFLPARRTKSRAERIMGWVISGNPDGKEALHELFPLPEEKRPEGAII